MVSIGFETDLERLVRDSPWFMAALGAVRALHWPVQSATQSPPWGIGAGAVRNLVWDALHGHAAPSALIDVDVADFDPSAPLEHDAELERLLASAAPGIPWEVTNQAHVHRWFEACFGHPVAPLRSLADAVASWPEYATAVGVHLTDGNSVRVIAPYGLS